MGELVTFVARSSLSERFGSEERVNRDHQSSMTITGRIEELRVSPRSFQHHQRIEDHLGVSLRATKIGHSFIIFFASRAEKCTDNYFQSFKWNKKMIPLTSLK